MKTGFLRCMELVIKVRHSAIIYNFSNKKCYTFWKYNEESKLVQPEKGFMAIWQKLKCGLFVQVEVKELIKTIRLCRTKIFVQCWNRQYTQIQLQNSISLAQFVDFIILFKQISITNIFFFKYIWLTEWVILPTNV
jgi:hypothetical protein